MKPKCDITVSPMESDGVLRGSVDFTCCRSPASPPIRPFQTGSFRTGSANNNSANDLSLSPWTTMTTSSQPPSPSRPSHDTNNYSSLPPLPHLIHIYHFSPWLHRCSCGAVFGWVSSSSCAYVWHFFYQLSAQGHTRTPPAWGLWDTVFCWLHGSVIH